MASNKRTVIEISSDSDDDNPLVNRRRKLRRRSQPQQVEADPEDIQHKVTDFLNFLDGALPRSLIPCDVADYIQRESNICLATARQQGVSLDDVFIGRDCLPDWPQRQWDPEDVSLHCAIQNQLLDLDVANVLGDALRGLLMDKGNRKLEEARQLGCRLEDITIGAGLLATWDSQAPELEDGHELENPLSDQVQREELVDEDMVQSSAGRSIQRSLIFSQVGTPDLDAITLSDSTSVVDSASTANDSSGEYDSCSDSSDSSSSEYSESSIDDEEEADDTICMRNAVHPEPEYADSDDEAPHILHDVEVAGCREGDPDVDLEVYVVEDDSDVDDLPELELAIDGDAFAYYFGDDGAVEVEIPGMDLRCSLDVPLDPSYADGDADMEDVCFDEEDYDDGDDNSLFNEDEDMGGQEDDGANTQPNADEASAVPLAQDDEERDSGIQITEDGFIW